MTAHLCASKRDDLCGDAAFRDDDKITGAVKLGSWTPSAFVYPAWHATVKIESISESVDLHLRHNLYITRNFNIIWYIVLLLLRR